MNSKLTVFIILFFISAAAKPQTISPLIFGQNAWMPDTSGDVNFCRGDTLGVPCVLKGNLYDPGVFPMTKDAGVRIIRFGGEAADQNRPTNHQYIKFIDSTRMYGMEPIIQLPYDAGYYNADTAAEIVNYLNNIAHRNIRYFIIGNEPDRKLPNGYNYLFASQIAGYIKPIAERIKQIDSTLIIIGPELKYYNYNNNLVTDLLDPHGPFDITGKVPGHTYGYVDIFTFHYYPLSGNYSRDDVVFNLLQGNKYHLHNILDSLRRRVDLCNMFHQRQGQNEMKIGITELNLTYANPWDTTLAGHSAVSFIAGQYWAEVLEQAMKYKVELITFWSMVENSLGFLRHDDLFKRPTYHHFSLMANHFSGEYCPDTVLSSEPKFKVVASKNQYSIAVMVMNQRKTADFGYTVKLGGDSIENNSEINIIIKNTGDSGIEYMDTIERESTVLLLFDCEGHITGKYVYRRSDGDGGIPVYSKVGNHDLVSAKLPDDITTSWDCPVTIAPIKVDSLTRYSWYDKATGELISDTSDYITVRPTRNTTYLLIAKKGACYIQDEIRVDVSAESCLPMDKEKVIEVRNDSTPVTEEVNRELNIIPNPASKEVSFKITGLSLTGEGVIGIYNAVGHKVFERIMMFHGNQAMLDIEDLDTGMYYVRIYLGGYHYQEKLMVQK